MPTLTPLPTQIKNYSPLMRLYKWVLFRRRWEVSEDWHFQFPDKGPLVVIPKGFVFDGVSVPKPMHWFLSPTGVLFIPGLIHDFSYRYGYLWAYDDKGEVYKYKENEGRHFWDGMFKTLGLELNAMYVLNAFSRLVLFVCGWRSWDKNRKKPFDELRPGSK